MSDFEGALSSGCLKKGVDGARQMIKSAEDDSSWQCDVMAIIMSPVHFQCVNTPFVL